MDSEEEPPAPAAVKPETEVPTHVSEKIIDNDEDKHTQSDKHETETAENNGSTTNPVSAEEELQKAAPPPPPAGSRFFSRIGSSISNVNPGSPLMSGVLSRAQKLRDQAVSEVDRLRQQQQASTEDSKEGDNNSSAETAESGDGGDAVVIKEEQPTAANTNNNSEGNEKGETTKQEDASVKTASASPTPKRSNSKTTPTKKQQSASPLRAAFNVVRSTSTDAAKNLIFPPSVFGSSYSNSEEEEGDGSSLDDRREDDEGTQEDDGSSASIASGPSPSPAASGGRSNAPPPIPSEQRQTSSSLAPVKSLVNAYSEFKTVGRYRMMKDNEPPQNVITAHDPKNASMMMMSPASQRQQQQQQQQQGNTPAEKRHLAKQLSGSPVVGGANRVVGLRFLNWDKVVGPIDSATPTLTMETKSMHTTTSSGSVVGGGANSNDDETATNSTSVDVTDTASTVTSVTVASEDGASTAPPTLPKTLTERSRTGVSYYEDVVRSALKPGQRAMFFGQGVLGVILKPTYIASWRGVDGQGLLSATTAAKKGGVFVDSLIRGSQAHLSGVVHVGDIVVRIGTVDVSKMTLEEVVDVIANAKRPNIMVVTAVHEVELVTVPGDKEDSNSDRKQKKCFASSLDLAFAYVNKIATEGEGSMAQKDAVKGELQAMKSLLEDSYDSKESEEEVTFGAESTEEDGDDDKTTDDEVQNDADSKSDPVPVQTVTVTDSSSDDEKTPSNACETKDDELDLLAFYASRRTNGHNQVPQLAQKLPVILESAALTHPEFRSVLRRSFVECCSDPRRCKFLKCYFYKKYQSRMEVEEKKRKEQRFQNISDALRRQGDVGKDVTCARIQQQLLELYLELLQFHDAARVCSESDRERLLARARYISTRFLAFDDSENNGALPDFVVELALGGTEQVLSVRRAIEDEDDFFDNCEDGDGFSSMRSCLEAFMSVQEAYLRFLTSDVCARMRAYLRGSAPFLPVEPLVFLKTGSDMDSSSQNFLLHAVLHLLCMKGSGNDDDIDCINNDAIILNKGDRNMGAVSLLGCAIFIARTLQKSSQAVVEALIEDGMTGRNDNMRLYTKLTEDFQFLWEVFIAPAGGSLSTLNLSEDVQTSLDSVRRLLVSSVDKMLAADESSDASTVSLARVLTSVEVASSVHSLREALLNEYSLSIYPVFRRHIFHEWACQEAKQNRFDNVSRKDEYNMIPSGYNGMLKGSMKRFIRQVELPEGVSLHRPSPKAFAPVESDVVPRPHEWPPIALVFGTDIPSDDSGSVTSSSVSDGNNSVRRFVSAALQSGETVQHRLVPDSIPPVFESYAVVPPFHARPFLGTLRDEKKHRISVDGWEVSLNSFMVPSGSNVDGSEWLYCASLVFRKPSVSVQSKSSRKYLSEQEIELECVRKLVSGNSFSQSKSDCKEEFQSPLVDGDSDGVKSRQMIVSSEPNVFNQKLQGQSWSQMAASTSDVVVGVALISDRNETFRMRETLSLVYNDFCHRHLCKPLVDILGNFSDPGVEESCLQMILEPYLAFSTSKWADCSLREQELQFSDISGTQLMQSLPPVPLALLFVTLLLEQKVVLASSRRGMLMAASDAIMQLLKPLQWKHLLVPLVPESMMNDLVHYPAPFVLGIPTDEKKSGEILSALPEDVTLVDLDVGRVMLASEFVHDSSSTSSTAQSITRALRSQVLYLAESLGGTIGAAIDDSWASDSPLQVIPHDNNNKVDDFVSIRNICHDFILELLSGVYSCCLWIEEKCDDECNDANEPAIIFDEERFVGIKKLRAEGLHLPLFQDKQKNRSSSSEFCLGIDHFDLIIEAFLRTQSLSNFISHGDKESMMFW